MGLTLHTLAIDEAAVAGNVELKVAAGTLPQRLTIEKSLSTHWFNSGIDGSLHPYLSPIDGKLYVTRGLYGVNPTLRRINPATMAVELEYYDSTFQYKNMIIVGDDSTHLFLWDAGAIIYKIKKSDFTIELTSESIVGNIYCYPILVGDYIYCASAWGAGAGIIKIQKSDLTIVETFGQTKINTYMSWVWTEDHDNFYWQYATLNKYTKSTDTNVVVGKTMGSDLTNALLGYPYYGGLRLKMKKIADYDNPGSYDWLVWHMFYLLRFDFETLTNKEITIFPTKFGNKAGWEGAYVSLNFAQDTNYWMFNPLGIDGYMGQLIKINSHDNRFDFSYAEWSLSGLTGTLKKIITRGGFNRGYAYNYATAKQIKVEYYTDDWIEIDIDSAADLDIDISTIEKIRISLQNRYMLGDVFPYVSAVQLLIDSTDTTPPATPSGLTVDEPPAKPSGVGIEAL